MQSVVKSEHGTVVCNVDDLNFKKVRVESEFLGKITTENRCHCYINLDNLFAKYIVVDEGENKWSRVDVMFRNKAGKIRYEFVGHINPEDGFLYLNGGLNICCQDEEYQNCEQCFPQEHKIYLSRYRYHKLKH